MSWGTTEWEWERERGRWAGRADPSFPAHNCILERLLDLQDKIWIHRAKAIKQWSNICRSQREQQPHLNLGSTFLQEDQRWAGAQCETGQEWPCAVGPRRCFPGMLPFHTSATSAANNLTMAVFHWQRSPFLPASQLDLTGKWYQLLFVFSREKSGHMTSPN